MSKGSNSDDINIAYLEKLAQAVSDLSVNLEKISPSYGANGQLEKTLMDIAKSVNNGDATLKQMLKTAANTQKDIRSVEYDIDSTAKYNKTVNMFIKLLEEKIGNSKLDDVLVKKIATAFENLDVTAILESEKIGQRGGKGAPLKNVMDNEKLNKVNEDLARRIGLNIDKSQNKLISFFQSVGPRLKKTLVAVGADLIEGLEKSKWVGGALKDTFRLVGLLGGQWLSQFGQLGKILGGAFYVAMETFGPTFVHLLLTGFGKLLSTILPAILGGIGKIGGALGWGRLAGTAIGGTISYSAFNAAEDSNRQGMLENANFLRLGGVAAGAGALAMGTGAVASGIGTAATAVGATGVAAGAAGLAAALNPIGIALVTIGGAVAGIAALYKAHKQKEMEHFYGTKEYYEKVLTGMAELSDEEKAMTGLQGTAGGPGSIGYRMSDNGDYVTYGKMKVSKRDKSILNLHELSQKEASEALQAYEKADPEGFHSLYEWVDSNHADLNSFETDAVKFGSEGQAVAALGKKGQTREIDEFRSFLRKYLMNQGHSYDEASRIISTYKMSSGKATGSNKYHTPGSESSQYKTHFDRYGRTIDIIGEGMNAFGGKALEAFYGTGERGYKVKVEQENEGKSTGVHAHINPARNVMSMAAQLNVERYDDEIKEQKVEAQKNTIAVENLLKEVDPKAYEKEKGAADWSAWDYSAEGLRKHAYEKALEKKGVTLDSIGSTDVQAYSRMNNGQKEFAFIDDSGNVTWMMQKHAILYLQQYGANY